MVFWDTFSSSEKFVQGSHFSWWRHPMETFAALLVISAGNSPVTGEFPAQRPVTQSFDVFFDLRLNNGWVNNREAGGLRRHHAHYEVIVMYGKASVNFIHMRHNSDCPIA